MIQRLAELPQFKTWQDLSKVVYKENDESEIISQILKAYKTTDTVPKFDWESKVLKIDEIKYDLNIDWEADRIKISQKCIQDIENHTLGTDRFIDSVKEIEIYNVPYSKSALEIQQDADCLQKCFRNSERMRITYYWSYNII